MTSAIEAAQPIGAGGEAGPAQPRAVIAGVMAADGVQIGMVLDADAPISVMLDPLLKVVNNRLQELNESTLQPTGRGRWALCLVDGTVLRSGQSLTEQNVYDGDRLWLRFIEDTERRSPVIEHISTAVAVNLSKRFAPVDARMAVWVGVATLCAGVVLATGLLWAWRCGNETWLTAGCSAGLALLMFIAASLILLQSRTVTGRQVGDAVLLTGLVPLMVAAAGAVPGPVGAAHAALAFGVAAIMAPLLIRLTGRHLATYTALTTIGVAVGVACALRMMAMTSPITLMTCVFLVAVLAYHGAPSLSRWLAGLRLPVFPSATSRWVFEARPDLPTTVAADGSGKMTLEAPGSVREVVLRAQRARSFLTGILVGLGVLVVCCVTGLCDPESDRVWLPVLIAILTSGFLVLRGRSFRDRWQAIVVTMTGLIIVAAVVVRFVVVLWNPVAVVIGMGVLTLVPTAGLISAVVVPNTIYSPLFRKFVEWIEYLCLMPLFPLGLWLMNTYEAIRYR